jgi:hypothetical protein
MNKTNWISIEDGTPPDTELLVRDQFGNEAIGSPTYYPFKVIPHPPYTKWSSKIESCEPYWDGGWLITAENNFLSNIKGNVTHWATLTEVAQPKK